MHIRTRTLSQILEDHGEFRHITAPLAKIRPRWFDIILVGTDPEFPPGGDGLSGRARYFKKGTYTCIYKTPPIDRKGHLKLFEGSNFCLCAMNAYYAPMGMWRRIPLIGFSLAEIRVAGSCHGASTGFIVLCQVESYMKDVGMAGLASAWAMAR